jgi:transmembrane sensor
VTAGQVVVEDVGTVFVVRLADDGSTFVSVESGSVRVRGAGADRLLESGASESFPLPASSATVEPPASASAGVTTRATPWRKLAKAGDYDRAYKAMVEQGTAVRDDPEDLLLAADAARLSGHADRAVPLLRRVVDGFPSDSRAGLAAFTLGRVLLDDLGQPREAARAFATAYARGGPLAEDALAREAEAYSRAGDRTLAKDAARRYMTAYPNGRRAASVRRIAEGP